MSTRKSRTTAAEPATANVEAGNAPAGIVGAIAAPKPVVGEIVEYDSVERSAIRALSDQLGIIDGQIIDNLPADKLTRWKMENAATTGVSVALADMINETIEIRFWRVEVVELLNENNGELDRAPRVVLWLRDGRIVHAISFGIFQVVASLNRTFGREELPEGFAMKVVSIKTRKAHRMISLQAAF